jgi:hypothetical protein
MMSARRLGRLAGVVFALAVVFTLGGTAAANVNHNDATGSQTVAVQASTLIIEWE